ncbi:MAG: metallophosphoesterase family protein [Pirellulaceae bacterium]|nr:metallophosphoesterase family protein [Pirellulaceae bacterium]
MLGRSTSTVWLVPLLVSVMVVDAAAQAVRQGTGQSTGQSTGQGSKRGGSGLGNYTVPPPANNVPEHLFNILLGRPTDSSMTIRALFHRKAKAFVEYGLESGQLTAKTPTASFEARATHDFVLKELKRDSRYYYRLVYSTNSGDQQATDEYTFQTQRDPGTTFVFTVTSDSHLDENTSGEVYLQTLANALHDAPDFHFELGDTFMTGKYVKPELSEPQYLAQRYYLGSLCHSAPLFFALGNHDGESGSRGSTAWATRTRKRLFPNPEPDEFYTGNDQSDPEVGLPQDYYQWKWGDAQFIVLDPFRYTTQRSRDGNNWSWTLGEQQYRWLKASLEGVDAKYRFVFLHHLVGGSPTNNRGGVEVAKLWEWGGLGNTGENEFSKQRPGWEMPIHDLLVRHGVSIVFHGHDHLFIKQDLDGIVYQEVPQPGHPRSGSTNTAKEYGYLNGEIQSSSGYIRVRVGEDAARVDYVRTYLPAAESRSKRNGDVSFSYTVNSPQARKSN